MNSEQQEGKNSILKEAWDRFLLYDKNASRIQSCFKREQFWILFLGVFVTILTLTKTQLLNDEIIERNFFIDELLQYLIILLPITISVLTAAANRLKKGNKWVLLRAGAEAIKREIFRYRVFEETIAIKEPTALSWKERLANKMNQISDKLVKTEVNMMALSPVEEKDRQKLKTYYGDYLSLLEPDDYIKDRIENQYGFYESKTKALERKLKRLYWLIYIIGGLGTLLAAAGFQLWVALTTTLAGTITTFLQYQQVENTLMIYNQAATNLSNIKAWWLALPDEKKKKTGNNKKIEKLVEENIKKLVEHTETALQNELSGWVQQMEDVLADLYKTSE